MLIYMLNKHIIYVLKYWEMHKDIHLAQPGQTCRPHVSLPVADNLIAEGDGYHGQ